jgi:hypothetical protein
MVWQTSPDQTSPLRKWFSEGYNPILGPDKDGHGLLVADLGLLGEADLPLGEWLVGRSSNRKGQVNHT